MEIFGKELRENWFDKEYDHAGYHFVEVYREEEFIIYKDSDNHFEVYQRRQSDKYRNYRPNKSHWGTYAWTCMAYQQALNKINTVKELNNE